MRRNPGLLGLWRVRSVSRLVPDRRATRLGAASHRLYLACANVGDLRRVHDELETFGARSEDRQHGIGRGDALEHLDWPEGTVPPAEISRRVRVERPSHAKLPVMRRPSVERARLGRFADTRRAEETCGLDALAGCDDRSHMPSRGSERPEAVA